MLKPAGAAVAVALLFALPAMAQTSPTYTAGSAIPNAIAKMGTGGRVTSGGDINGDSAGNGISPFSVLDKNNTAICARTGSVSAPHNALCLGHDKDGNGIISLDSLGGLGPKKLYIRLNGTLIDVATLTAGGTGGAAIALHTGGCVALHAGGCISLHGS